MLRIYALLDPRTADARYVGVTKNALGERLRGHLNTARGDRHYPVCLWIKKLRALGMKPTIVLLEECETIERECFWIAHYRAAGSSLLNCSGGGDGLRDPTPEVRKRLSDSHMGNKHSPETRAKMSKSRLGSKCPWVSKARKGKKLPASHGSKVREGVALALAEGKYKPATGERHGSRTHPESRLRGSAHPNAKLTEEIVREMRDKYVPWKYSTPRLAKEYGVPQSTVHLIVTRKGWTHIP